MTIADLEPRRRERPHEGSDGTDAIVVNGGGDGETFTATADGSRVRFDQVALLPFSLDIGTSERLVVNANGSNNWSHLGDLAWLIALDVNSGTATAVAAATAAAP